MHDDLLNLLTGKSPYCSYPEPSLRFLRGAGGLGFSPFYSPVFWGEAAQLHKVPAWGGGPEASAVWPLGVSPALCA